MVLIYITLNIHHLWSYIIHLQEWKKMYFNNLKKAFIDDEYFSSTLGFPNFVSST